MRLHRAPRLLLALGLSLGLHAGLLFSAQKRPEPEGRPPSASSAVFFELLTGGGAERVEPRRGGPAMGPPRQEPHQRGIEPAPRPQKARRAATKMPTRRSAPATQGGPARASLPAIAEGARAEAPPASALGEGYQAHTTAAAPSPNGETGTAVGGEAEARVARSGTSQGGEGEGLGDGPGGGGDGEDDARVLAQISARLEAAATRCYPVPAQRRRKEGVAKMRFCIDEAGQPHQLHLVESSGTAQLDAAARCVIERAAPFPTLRRCLAVPIRFALQR